jgi:hypothetical protein
MLRALAACAPTAILSLASFALALPVSAQEAVAAAPAASEEGFVPLFNGKDFSGWHKEGGQATYEIDGDQIVGKVGPGPNTFLCTDKLYGDFIFKCELKLDIPGNSGIQFRSEINDKGKVFGYQMEVDPSDRKWAGGIYDESRRGWLYPLTGHPEAQAAFKVDDWNEYVIEARGPHLKTFVNGVPCADLLDAMTLEGLIALQVHSGKEGQIRWRNIRIKDLGKTEWTSLFDGDDLAGWKKSGGGDWKVADGAIVGTATKDEKRHGFLVSEKAYSDFAVRVVYQANAGNSGVFLRFPNFEAGDLALQAEIDPEKDAGGLYESGQGGRGWVVQPKPEDAKKWYKPGTWNEMTVIAIGDRVVVQVNGQKSAETDKAGGKAGPIALQLHAGQDMDVKFKSVEVIDLSQPK